MNGGSRRRGHFRFSLLLPAAFLAVAAASVFAVWELQDTSDDARRAQVALARIETLEARLEDVPWDADDVPAAVARGSADVERALADVPGAAQRASLLELHRDYAALLVELGEIVAGGGSGARAFDDGRVGPAEARLERALAAAATAQARTAASAQRLEAAGTALAIGLGFGVVFLAIALFERARAGRRAAEARLRLLTEENERLRELERLADAHAAAAPSQLVLPVRSLPHLVAPLLAGGGKAHRADATKSLREDAQGLLELANTLLFLLESMSEPVPLELEDVDLADVAAAAADEEESLALRDATGPVVVRADRRRLAQLLRSLLDGAAPLRAERTPLQLAAFCTEGGGVLEVRAPRLEATGDTAESRAALYSRGGVDLAVADALARAHGGRLEVDWSESGATLRAFLPAPVPASPPVARAAALTLP